MSEWTYRGESIGHLWEFVSLGHEKQEGRVLLYGAIYENEARVDGFLIEHRPLILDLVEATPSRRGPMLRRMSGKRPLEEMALILGAWQHCRKAVRAFDWISETGSNFVAGNPYRVETSRKGVLYDQIRAQKISKWPFQWEKSPYKGERSRVDSWEVSDFDEMMDNFDPETGLY